MKTGCWPSWKSALPYLPRRKTHHRYLFPLFLRNSLFCNTLCPQIFSNWNTQTMTVGGKINKLRCCSQWAYNLLGFSRKSQWLPSWWALSPFALLCYSTSHMHYRTNCAEDHPLCEHQVGSNSILHTLYSQCQAWLLPFTRWTLHIEWINGQAND